MGLDIAVRFEVETASVAEPEPDRLRRALSRTFCDFMCRRNAVDGTPELDQIGALTGVDIAPLYAMDSYRTQAEAEDEARLARSADEQARIYAAARESRSRLAGNLDHVLQTVQALIERLAAMDDLANRLDDPGDHLLNPTQYFAHFADDRNEGYLANHFGTDLRNLRRQLQQAKAAGANTAYFSYG